VVPGIVDGAELTGGDTVNGGGGADINGSVSVKVDYGWDVIGGVADFDAYFVRSVTVVTTKRSFGATKRFATKTVWVPVNVDGSGEPVDGVYLEFLFVGGLGVVAVGDEEDVFLDVLLDGEPGTAAEAEAVALTDGVEPESFVHAYLLACLDVDDQAGVLAEVTADVVVVVYLAEEADALRVFAVGVDEVLALGDAAHLVLGHAADGEDCLLELPGVELGEEVGLILDGVGGGAEPFPALLVDFGLGVVACGDEVVVLASFLVEGAELDEAVAHDVGVGGEACADFLHGVACDVLPVFLVAVDDGEGEVVAACHGGCHLDVFLGGAVEVTVFLGCYAYVVAVGLASL